MSDKRLMSQTVYAELRSAILSGEILPGDRLRARALSQRFGTSEIPVREALWMLQRDGLVDNLPYAGCVVRSFTPEEIVQTYEVRVHLEVFALSLSKDGITPDVIAAVETNLDNLHAALEARDYANYGELNREFHMGILQGCSNTKLLDVLDGLWAGQVAYRRVFQADHERAWRSLEEHREIAAAVFAGELERAAELLTAHRARGAQSVIAALSDAAPSQKGRKDSRGFA